jgi:hypothetical protein
MLSISVLMRAALALVLLSVSSRCTIFWEKEAVSILGADDTIGVDSLVALCEEQLTRSKTSNILMYVSFSILNK